MADALETNPSGGDAIMAAASSENATPSLPHSDTASGSAVPAAGPAKPVDWQAILGDGRRLRQTIPKQRTSTGTYRQALPAHSPEWFMP